MDLLIPMAVLLLVVSVVFAMLAKQGRTRQAEQTARKYGVKSTCQPTFEDPAVRPNASHGPTAAPAATLGSVKVEAREIAERMARDLAALLQSRVAGSTTFEATTSTSSSTSRPEATAMSHAASMAPQPGGISFTERSTSLTEETAARVKSLALAGKRGEALALLSGETGMEGRSAERMLDMIVEQLP